MSDKITIDAPDIAPVKGSLLEKIDVITAASGYELYYGVEYTPVPEGQNLPVPDPGVDKVFAEIAGLNESYPFAAYRGLDTSLMRFHGTGEATVKDLYERSEAYGVERSIQTIVLSPKAVDLTPTPGTAVTNPRLALGLLEQYARDNFSGLPLISGNALALTLVEDALTGTGTSITTLLETPVALAGGYGTDGPGALVSGPGQAWLYITGPIHLWKGGLNTSAAPDLKKNRDFSLAEAPYAASVDGIVAAVLVGI